MEFSNLTNEQIEWLEAKLKDAYTEGYFDGWHNENYLHSDMEKEFSESLTKNQTCHLLAERFMKPSKLSFDVSGLRMEDYVESVPTGMLDKFFRDKNKTG